MLLATCRAEWLTGYKVSEVMGISCFVMKHPNDVHEMKEYTKRNKICEFSAACSSHAHHMLITCSSHAHHMLITCSSHAHHMLITCSVLCNSLLYLHCSVQRGVLLCDTISHCHSMGPVDMAGEQGLPHCGEEWRASRDTFLVQNSGVR